MGSIADLVGEGWVSTWAAPIVCGVFEVGSAAGRVENEWRADVEKRWVWVTLSAV